MTDVSVIIPAYNAAEFIEECVYSVSRQEKVDVEIIVINDASSDNTAEILDRLRQELPNLVAINLEENGGQSSARNIGMERAKGEYIALLDSDDYYPETNVLTAWVSHAQTHRLDVCITQYTRLNLNGEFRPGWPVPIPETTVINSISFPEIVNARQSWQLLFRSQFLKDENLKFSSRLRQREDRLFMISVLAVAPRVGVLPINAIIYRDHPNSTMRRVDQDQLRQFNIHIEILLEIMRGAEKRGLHSPDFARANAISYAQQFTFYWSAIVLEMLDGEPDERDCALQFIANLDKLCAGLPPFYEDKTLTLSQFWEETVYGAVLDITRLLLPKGDSPELRRVLNRERLHPLELEELVETTDLPWVETAASEYLAFNRGFRHEQTVSLMSPALKLSSVIDRLILHVGMPKTGTSSLQSSFEVNRLRLIERGILYPLAGVHKGHGSRRHRTDGHAGLVENALSGETDVNAWLAAEVKSLEPHKIHTVIVSAENLLSLRWAERSLDQTFQNTIKTLLSQLDVPNIEVVALFRRPDVWVRTFYRELLCNPFNDFVDSPKSFLDSVERSSLLDYDKVIALLKSGKGVRKLHVDAYENVRETSDTVSWFYDRAGIAMEGLLPPRAERANESLTDAMAENIRLLKVLGPERQRRELLFSDIASTKELLESSYSLFSPEHDRYVREHFGSFVSRFNTRFGRAATEVAPSIESAQVVPILRTLTDENEFVPGVLGRKVFALQEELDSVLNSHSWTITEPLRFVSHLAQRAREIIRL